jgi:FAD/FMN-containing dehydrogenase
MKDQVVNMTVVLSDGTVVKTGQRARKSSAGYDLARVFVGVGHVITSLSSHLLIAQPLMQPG